MEIRNQMGISKKGKIIINTNSEGLPKFFFCDVILRNDNGFGAVTELEIFNISDRSPRQRRRDYAD